MLIGLSVEASANTAVKIHLINLKASLSRRTLEKSTLMCINSCAQCVEPQRDNSISHILHMNIIIITDYITLTSIIEDIP